MWPNSARRRAENRINEYYRKIREVVEFLRVQQQRGGLDSEREIILSRLQQVLNIVNNDPSYRNGVSRLNDDGIIEYGNMLSRLCTKMIFGGARSRREWDDLGRGLSSNQVRSLPPLPEPAFRAPCPVAAAIARASRAESSGGLIMHTFSREEIERINNSASAATLVFLAVGLVPGAKVSGVISTITSAMLVADDFANDNVVGVIIGISAIVLGRVGRNFVQEGIDRAIREGGLKVIVGRTGRFYSANRRGAIARRDVLERELNRDLASGVYGRLAPEVTRQIISRFHAAFRELERNISEE